MLGCESLSTTKLFHCSVFREVTYTKLYWFLFPIEDLRQAVHTAKRILTKGKLDKHLTDLHQPIYECQRWDRKEGVI